jgi:hypothetical protein
MILFGSIRDYAFAVRVKDCHYFHASSQEEASWQALKYHPVFLSSSASRLSETGELVVKASGKNALDAFVPDRKLNWDRHCSQVTDYEPKQCSPVLRVLPAHCIFRIGPRVE